MLQNARSNRIVRVIPNLVKEQNGPGMTSRAVLFHLWLHALFTHRSTQLRVIWFVLACYLCSGSALFVLSKQRIFFEYWIVYISSWAGSCVDLRKRWIWASKLMSHCAHSACRGSSYMWWLPKLSLTSTLLALTYEWCSLSLAISSYGTWKLLYDSFFFLTKNLQFVVLLFRTLPANDILTSFWHCFSAG